MSKWHCIGLWGVFCLCCGLPAQASFDLSPPPPEIEVLSAQFGLFAPNSAGRLVLTPSKIVPDRKGQRYGWAIRLQTTRPTVRWREELTLPAAPATWGGEELPPDIQTISRDNRTSVIQADVVPVNGMIENVWEVAPGDPRGHYVIRVTIDGANLQVFEFDVK
jgi:hypothetical protein